MRIFLWTARFAGEQSPRRRHPILPRLHSPTHQEATSDAATLQHLAASHESLNALLLKYLHVVLVQTARSVACCRFHSLEQRLARWLLTHVDRSWSTDLPVTHDQLALMLGARRAGVSVAAGRLEQRGLISGGRGHIVVERREQLMEAACSCYMLDRRTYEQGMGVPPGTRRY
jgi:hypothetical protein